MFQNSGSQNFHGPSHTTAIILVTAIILGFGLVGTASANQAPIVSIGGPYTIYEGQSVALDTSGTYDPDGDKLQYRYDTNNDGTWDCEWNPYFAKTTIPNPLNISYYDEYSGDLVLEVTDGKLRTSAVTSVTVLNGPPVIRMRIYGFDGDTGLDTDPNPTIAPNQPIYLFVYATDQWDDLFTYTLDYGNGEIISGSSTSSYPYKVYSDYKELTYDQPGTYTITLTATDVEGASSVAVKTITVDPLVPIANFSYEVITPGHASFQDTSIPPEGAEIVSWSWDFGDGYTSDEQNPSHVYEILEGDCDYLVTLTVTTDAGYSSTMGHYILIPDTRPEAYFSYSPINPIVNQEIQFTDESVDYDGEIVAWHWDFGDGTTSEEQNPTHSYQDPTSYWVSLTVTDDTGLVSFENYPYSMEEIWVDYDPTPSAAFNMILGNLTTPTQFFDCSYGEYYGVQYYDWDFGDGTSVSGNPNPVHQYTSPGVYNVTLTATVYERYSDVAYHYAVILPEWPSSSFLMDATSIDSLSLNSGKVVYSAYVPKVEDPQNTDIFLYDMNTGETTQITDDLNHQHDPTISGNTIVWCEYGTTEDCRIRGFDLSTEQWLEIASETHFVWWPIVSGDKVVYVQHMGDHVELILYDLAMQEKKTISTNSMWVENPFDFDGNYVVFQEYAYNEDNSWYNALYLYNIETDEKILLSSSQGGINRPSVSGTRVVWDEQDPDNYYSYSDIHMYDITSGTETLLDTETGDQVYPDISGNYVVWLDYASGNGDLYLYNIADSTITLLTKDDDGSYFPRISGNTVIWYCWGYQNTVKALMSTTIPTAENLPPEVDFSYTPESPTTSDIVQFIDESLDPDGEIVSWLWVIDDHQSVQYLTTQEVSFQFRVPGEYGVHLEVTDNEGLTTVGDQQLIYVSPVESTIADFYTVPENPVAGEDVGFMLNCTLAYAEYDNTVDSVEWLFDDSGEGFSVEFSPYYVYEEAGDYAVTLTVWDVYAAQGYAEPSTVTKIIHVSEGVSEPVAGFSADITEGTAPLTVQFIDESVYAETWEWDFGDGSTSTAQNPIHTYATAGTYSVTLTVTDDDDLTATVTQSVVVTSGNLPPVVEAGDDLTGSEGAPIVFSGSYTDSGDTGEHTIAWTFGDGAEASGTLTPAHTYADNGIYTATLTVTDALGGSSSDTLTVTVENAPPVISGFTLPTDPVALGATVTATATFTEAGTADTHTATWAWGDGTTTTGTVAAGSVSATRTYASAGVYLVALTVTDSDGASDTVSSDTYIVVYDPNGGFVTGGGWIDSPVGAYPADTSLTGKATFGFVSKYQKGATVPTGQTEFQFKAGDMNFHSDSYDWLVVAGARAQYKGVGSINGGGDYGFMLSAVDAALTPSTNVDLFRIKIWDKATDTVVYDNQMGVTDDAEPTTAISGGSIVIHTKK